jgi:ribosome-binding factor A
MQYKRADRVAAVIHEKIGSLLVNGLKDPAFGFITITKVQVTDDVRHAKIYYSVYGDQKQKEQTAAALERAKGFIRTEVGSVLSLRFVPALSFYFDDSTEYADHIEQLIKKIHDESK